MGGAVGHLYHLYDNPDLSFGEIKGILQAASAGKLEKVSEKLDGLNLVFTWDEAGSGLRVARNSGDIKSGGMDAAGLASKFADRGNLTDAFNSAYKVLNQALGALPPKIRAKVFGPNGGIWYSMELIYSANPNVIQYDGNNVVFHGWPVFKLMPDGTVDKGPGGGVDFLVKHLDQMQSSVKEKDWSVKGPALVAIKKMSDKSVLQKALTGINKAMASARVSDSETIQDYLFNYAQADAKAAKMPPRAIQDIAARVAGIPGAPNLTQIKGKIDKADVVRVQEYVKQGPKMIKSAIAPIEAAIHDFATEALRGLQSTLIAKSDKEVERLRAEVQKAIAAIQSSGNETAMAILQTQMKKLGTIQNLATPMEGVVFIHNGNAYKFTGAFAPVNQILGLFKYGRGKTKLTGESLENLIGMICESLIFEDDEGYYSQDETEAKKRHAEAGHAIEAWKTAEAKKRARADFLKNAGFSLDKAGADRARRRLAKDRQFKAQLDAAVDKANSRQVSDLEIPKSLKDELEMSSKRLRLFDPEQFGFVRPSKISGEEEGPAPPTTGPQKKSQMQISDVNPGEWYSWSQFNRLPAYGSTRKEKNAAAVSAEERADVGVGPGEERLATIFGGHVQGGSVSYDVVTPDGGKWEVKALESPSEMIRPGTEGKAALSATRDNLANIMKQLRNFVAAGSKPAAQEAFKGSHKSIINYVRDFLATEYEEIVGKGEVTDERFKDLYTVLKLVARMNKELHSPDEGPEQPSVVGLNDKKVNVDKPTFLDVSKIVQKSTGKKEVLDPFQIQEIVFSTLKDAAFKDPDAFFKRLFSSVKASHVFRGVDGVFIVNNAKGFNLIPRDQFDEVFKFFKISQATPRFKFTRF